MEHRVQDMKPQVYQGLVHRVVQVSDVRPDNTRGHREHPLEQSILAEIQGLHRGTGHIQGLQREITRRATPDPDLQLVRTITETIIPVEQTEVLLLRE